MARKDRDVDTTIVESEDTLKPHDLNQVWEKGEAVDTGLYRLSSTVDILNEITNNNSYSILYILYREDSTLFYINYNDTVYGIVENYADSETYKEETYGTAQDFINSTNEVQGEDFGYMDINKTIICKVDDDGNMNIEEHELMILP